MKANGQSFSSRAFSVLIATGMLLALSFGQVEKDAKKSVAAPTVLFVCEHGAAKSVMAAAYFNKLAEERRLPHKATFRGVNPDAVLNPVAKRGLGQDGFDTSGWKPSPVTHKDVERADQIVTLGCLLPSGLNVALPVTDWNDVSSPSQNYQLARDEIKRRVRQLLDHLMNEGRTAK